MIIALITFYLKFFCFFFAVHNNFGGLDWLFDFLIIKTISILWLLCPWGDNYNFLALNLVLFLVKLQCSAPIFLKTLITCKYVISSHFEKEVIFDYLVQYDKISVYNAAVEKFYNIPIDEKNQPKTLELYCIDYLKIKYISLETPDNVKFFNDLKISIETPIDTNNYNKNLRTATMGVLFLFYVRVML